MHLYHGTTLKNGQQIIKDGFIKANIKRNYVDYDEHIKNTTDGYVYLSVNLHTAYFYGNINLADEISTEKYVYIFSIEVDDKLLHPDYDEVKVITGKEYEGLSVVESINLCGCVTVNKDLDIRTAKSLILPGTLNQDADIKIVEYCRKLSALQLGGKDIDNVVDKIEKDSIWKPV